MRDDRPLPEVECRGDGTIRCSGDWTLSLIGELEQRLMPAATPAPEVAIDVSGIERLDTAGAWFLRRLELQLAARGARVVIEGLRPEAVALYRMIDRLGDAPLSWRKGREPALLEGLGRRVVSSGREYLQLLGFFGELTTVSLPLLLRPQRVRWRAIAAQVQRAGLEALPIVGLLSFLIGVVIAYQGGVQLQEYGATLFVADLVGHSVLRELGPLITAIIVAGRTGSAYTAQIGTMRVTEEIQALRSIGISPFQQLALPRILALFLALPLLTMFANIAAIFGGVLVAQSLLGVSPGTFLQRMQESVELATLLIGISKAPIFAIVIASIGCYQGFSVGSSAEDVGRRTTMSVVQSIFWVIIIDALFSVIYAELGI